MSATEAEVWEWLRTWLADWVPSKPIARHTDITLDLGIQGDDAWELFDAFSRRFELASGTFDFSKHFEGEGDFVTRSIVRLFRRKPFYPVTIGDMVDAALRDKFDYDHQSRQPRNG
jgi:hypothetical protein